MRFECILLLMASTVSLHSGSFVAGIDVIFPFVVAWKQTRKVDNENLDKIIGTKTRLIFRGYHSAVVVVSVLLPVSRRKWFARLFCSLLLLQLLLVFRYSVSHVLPNGFESGLLANKTTTTEC